MSEPVFTPEEYAMLFAQTFSNVTEQTLRILSETIKEAQKLGQLKGSEYSGDVDRLENFRRNGVDLELPMESIWRIYCMKHIDAIGQYIRDLQVGTKRQRLESLAGRADDVIVYMILFKAMLIEREREEARQ